MFLTNFVSSTNAVATINSSAFIFSRQGLFAVEGKVWRLFHFAQDEEAPRGS